MPVPFTHTLHALQPQPSQWLRSVVWIVGLAAWGGWFWGSEVSLVTISAEARLERTDAVYPVVSPVTAQVKAAHLQLGATVTATDLLVALDTTHLVLERTAHETAQDGLIAQKEVLQHEVATARQALTHARQVAQAAEEQAQTQILETTSASTTAQQALTRAEQLRTNGHLADAEWERVQADAEQHRLLLLSQQQALVRLQAEHLRDQSDRESALARLALQIQQIDQAHATAEAEIQRTAQALADRHIYPPVAGHLAQVRPIRAGSVVHVGDTLGLVVGTESLHAVAYFEPGAALGRIQSGQDARIQLEGFPWTQYGHVQARVTQVATDALERGVRVELQLFPPPGAPDLLQHGLPGQVEITYDTASPFTLLLRLIGHRLSPLATR